MLRVLLEHRAAVDATNENEQTSLNIVANEGHGAVVALLLAHGASRATVDKWGDTPLMNAEAQGHGEVAALLRE